MDSPQRNARICGDLPTLIPRLNPIKPAATRYHSRLGIRQRLVFTSTVLSNSSAASTWTYLRRRRSRRDRRSGGYSRDGTRRADTNIHAAEKRAAVGAYGGIPRVEVV